MNSGIQEVLELADIRVNGSRKWDLQVHDKRLWRRLVLYGGIGLGDAYIDGWWDCQEIDSFICRILDVATARQRQPWLFSLVGRIMGKLFNLQSLSRAFQVGEHHYDIGNDLYRAMLDKDLVYSCGYWGAGAANLEEAQRDKLELVCRKINLKPGMRVLDIGCGWGSFCKYAVDHYDVEAVGLTVSKEQVQYADKALRNYPVEILLQDYRTYQGSFDAIVSIGMFEHVGSKNYSRFMKVVRANLRNEGTFLLHTIGSNHSLVATRTWITKHIFPNGYIPSIKQIGKAVENRFVVEDLHNFGTDYDRTLMAWHERFEKEWPVLMGKKKVYDERFYRMWRFYLLSCAGAFRARYQQVWQWVLSPKGKPNGYNRPIVQSRIIA